jgi:hypothetical protein
MRGPFIIPLGYKKVGCIINIRVHKKYNKVGCIIREQLCILMDFYVLFKKRAGVFY